MLFTFELGEVPVAVAYVLKIELKRKLFNCGLIVV